MNYTKKQAERLIRDYNNFMNLSTEITYDNLRFLDHKFPKKVSKQAETEQLEEQLNKSFDDILYKQELTRTIKKAEKIVDKLNHLLSL